MRSGLSPLALVVLASTLLPFPQAAALSAPPHLDPPPTRRDDVVETIHGVKIADPYRWLEDQKSPQTRAWIDAENHYTAFLLDRLPVRKAIARRLGQLYRVVHEGMPTARGGRYFYSKRNPKDEQAVLYVRDGIAGKERVFLDPSSLRKDHTISADYLDFTDDGSLAAYSLRRGGDDRVEVRVRDARTLRDLPDRLPKAYIEGVSFARNGRGLFYTILKPLVGRRVRFHAFGSPVSADAEVFGKGYGPEIGVGAAVSENGRWLLLTVDRGWTQNDIFIKDLKSKGPIVPLITGIDAVFDPSIAGDTLVVRTDWKAPRRRILSIELPSAVVSRSAALRNRRDSPDSAKWLERNARVIIPTAADSIDSFSTVGHRVFVQYLHDVASRIRAYTLDGKPAGGIALPGLGTAEAPSGRWDDSEAFYEYESFTYPPTVFRRGTDSGKTSVWARTTLPFAPGRFETKQIWYSSEDGTRVPMFLVQRRGLPWDRSNPVLLTGYGGFGSSETPYFSSSAVLWAERGGIYAVANIRGGGEFGETWHRAGMLANKQNSFDDFIAAAEWLIARKATIPSRLAIMGGSNGGLLVGAALTQRPDLFRAVVCEYPLLDMLRYQKFLQGPQWVPEYGSADDPDQFKTLYAYSPYHHVQPGIRYPSVLFDTGDADTRVAPLHARKMAALLQSVAAPDRPILLHYDTLMGHSGGESTAKLIDDRSLVYAYLFHQLGIR